MGNCNARPRVLDPLGTVRMGELAVSHRRRRSSLGRLADFLTPQSSAIRDAVSEKLPTAANRGSQQVINLVEGPGFLEPAVWIAGLDVPVVKARATALEKAIDALLNPLLAALEELLAGKAVELGRGPDCHWHNANLKAVLMLLPTAAKMHGGVGLSSLSRAFTSMLTVVQALSQAATEAELPVPPEIFHVGSLNRLLAAAGTLAGQHVDAEPAAAGQERWRDWLAVAQALGLEEGALLVTLGAHAKALLLWMHVGASGRHAVAFQVRREHAFLDAFNQAQATELLTSTSGGCVLNAAFTAAVSCAPGAAEPGSHGHGPRKEFFLAAGAGMLEQAMGCQDSAPPLFRYNRWAGRFWFNSALRPSDELKAQFQFAGWLLGQSMHNRAALGAAFPALLFSKLLLGSSFKATLEVLQEFDVEAAAAVRGAATLRDADWRELLAQEGLDPLMRRRAYIKHAVHRLLVTDVAWQFAAFSQGFFTALDCNELTRWQLTAADLEEWASWAPGRDELRVEQLFRVVVEPGMASRAPALAPALLKVLAAWPPEWRDRFYRFATGAARPSVPQMEVLRLSMPAVAAEQPQTALARLPRAHTCTNSLELPDYCAALAAAGARDLELELSRVLHARLLTAVTHCTTFELGPLAPVDTARPDTRAELAGKPAREGSRNDAKPGRAHLLHKLGRPQQSGSPLSPGDSIPALRLAS